MRLRNNPKATQRLEASDLVIKTKQANYFNNENPIHIEIGMGKGDFIIGMAKKYPNINFVGVEKYATVLEKALSKLEESKLDNVRLLNIDALELLDYFEKHSVSEIYINFSDPWPKSRHAKRRLTYKTFLDLYKELLKSDGILKQKTDNQSLFESSIMSYNQYGVNLEFISVDLHHNVIAKDNVMTEYERKFSSLGQPIYSAWVTFNK